MFAPAVCVIIVRGARIGVRNCVCTVPLLIVNIRTPEYIRNDGGGGGGGGVEISGAGGGQRGEVRCGISHKAVGVAPGTIILLACDEASLTTVRSPAV